MGSVTGSIKQFLYRLILLINRIIAVISSHDKQLHNARFARMHELENLHSSQLDGTNLLLGVSQFNNILRVGPTNTRRELGNLLIVAPTRGGKGLLATSQLLSWKKSVVVNDIKGELFQQTAGYRKTLGKVLVIDPTGIGDRYDPLMGKQSEDELFSSARHLLHKHDEGEGAIFTQRATVMLTQLFLAARAEEYPPLPYVRQIVRGGLVAAQQVRTIYSRT